MRLEVLSLPLSRRAALGLSAGGVAGIALGHGVEAQAWPQTQLQPSPELTPALPEPDEDARLVQNLLTRAGVEVTVGSRRKPVFVIDTGAERTAISDRLAAELNLRPHRPVLVHGVTAAEMVRTVQLPRLEFFGQRFTDLKPPVFPFEVLAADGLLGLDVLSRFRLTLDLEHRKVSMTPSMLVSPNQRYIPGQSDRVPDQIIPTRTGRFGQLILTNVRVDGVEAVAFIDSGAQYSIGNRALMRAVDVRMAPILRPQVRVHGVIGQSLLVDVGAVTSLRLTQRELGAMTLLFGDLYAFQVLGLAERPALLLGADLLSRFTHVVLDYGQSRITLGPPSRRRQPPPVRSP